MRQKEARYARKRSSATLGSTRGSNCGRGELSMVRTLNDSEIAQVLRYERLIPAMERALAAFSAGEVAQPVRTMITIEAGQRYLGVMPAVTADGMGAKLVCFYPKNAAADLPTHLATIVLFESDTGRPLA